VLLLATFRDANVCLYCEAAAWLGPSLPYGRASVQALSRPKGFGSRVSTARGDGGSRSVDCGFNLKRPRPGGIQ